jgi:hypothetical protein
MLPLGERVFVAIVIGALWSLIGIGVAYARTPEASTAKLAACKAERAAIDVAEEANYATQRRYVPTADLVSNHLLKRLPKQFVVTVNSDGGFTITPTKQGGCPKRLTQTKTPTRSAGLVAACTELDRITREDAVGQPGNANVVADVVAYYERIKQINQTQNPTSTATGQLDAIITQLRALNAANPDQARTTAYGIATSARTSLEETCGFS